MLIGRITGCTRTIGKAQGYLGLPLRDVTLACTVNGPNTPAMETAWLPTPKEIAAINAGYPIILRVLGTGQPPVMLYASADERRPAMGEAISDQVDRALVQLIEALAQRGADYVEMARLAEAEGESGATERLSAATAAAVISTVLDTLAAKRASLKVGAYG